MDEVVLFVARASAWVGAFAVLATMVALAFGSVVWAFNRSRKVGVIVSALKLYYSLSRTERFELRRVGPEVESLRERLHRLELERLLCTCGAHGELVKPGEGGHGG